MIRRRLKNALVVLAGLALAALGVYNIVLKATLDADGRRRLLAAGAAGPRRRRALAPGGPAARAGVRAGDVLLAVDGEEVLSPARLESALAGRRPGSRLTYSLLREDERRALDVVGPAAAPGQRERLLLPLARRLLQPGGGHRRACCAGPPTAPSLHFYAVCVLFFLALLHLVHGQADAGRLGPLLDRLARRAVPARRLPALLPDLPRAPPARPAGSGSCPRSTCRPSSSPARRR